MTTQSTNLGPNPFSFTEPWEGAVLLDAALVEGGETAYLRYFEYTGVLITMRLASSAIADPEEAGPKFTAEVENGESSFAVSEAGGSSFTFRGPNNPDNQFSDPSEPYTYNLGVLGDDFTDWLNNLSNGDVTFTIDDGDPLVLADFVTPVGHENVAVVLCRAGGASLYNVGNDDGVRLAGDSFALAEYDLNFTRIYVTANPQLRISDSGGGDIEAIFSTGELADAQIHIQHSQTGVTTFDSADIDATRSTAARIILGADADPDGFLDDVESIADGARWIFAITSQMLVNIDALVEIRAGSPTVTVAAQAQQITTRDAAFSVRAGNPTVSASAQAQQVTERDAIVSVRAGNPTVRIAADNTPQVSRDAIVSVRAGNPTFSVAALAEEISVIVTNVDGEIGDDYVDLEWDKPEDTGGKPVLFYEITNGPGHAWRSTGTSATRYRVRNLKRDILYCFQVRAVTILGVGDVSDVFAVLIPHIRTQISTDLLIGQWRDSTKLKQLIDIGLESYKFYVLDSLDYLRRQQRIETAEGVYLDYIGERMGIIRPYITQSLTDDRFGFAPGTFGFDQAPFKGGPNTDIANALSDIEFRKILRARGILLFGDGSLDTLERASLALDEDAIVIDNYDMTVTITTNISWFFNVALMVDALPKNVGVDIIYALP